MIILMTTLTRALPNTLLATVGIVQKNPPFDSPLMTTNSASGPKVVEAGQMASMLSAVRSIDVNKTLIAPNLSQQMPHIIRPTAEDMVKPATRPAPVLDENPKELAYRGRKKGGTYSGNVPIAEATHIKMNLADLNIFLLWLC